MNHRERFRAIMDFRPFDRPPVWFFGTWRETAERWRREGWREGQTLAEATGMDPDWEDGMWEAHGLVRVSPLSPEKSAVLEETDEYRVVRTSLGAVLKEGKAASSIPQHIEEALKPTRESWERFKRFLDPHDPARRPAGWEATADALARRERTTCFLAGSLYGWPRNWLGTEGVSYLPYDDPALFEEIIEYVSEYFMALYRPVLARAQFDFAYFFEDCCFNTGPLFSPEIYRKFYDRHYRRMIDFYHSAGVRFVMIDSDGKVDDLLPCWLDSGFDIVFPIEVGTWKANPRAFRRKYGRRVRMLGGVDKHVIPRGEAAIRAELDPLRGLVAEGGYIPIPDHRIPPDCSLEQFRTYVGVFKEVFGAG
ncbi:MAG TPA: uroporphyrinogen decarboxylase family protein [Planctomycetota bacterium]|nr:uroporphyrinogen decarboxylase family protein [Planctomycetota bacterium]